MRTTLAAVIGAVSVTAALTSAGLASASARPAVATGGPTSYVQAAINQNVAIGTGNTDTILTTSPVLPLGHYLVDLTISFNNLTPGAQVLCGTGTTASTDTDTGNYGDVQNEGTTATTGSCSVISAVIINNANDHVTAWATVYQGPGGPAAYSWSESELHVGTLVVN